MIIRILKRLLRIKSIKVCGPECPNCQFLEKMRLRREYIDRLMTCDSPMVPVRPEDSVILKHFRATGQIHRVGVARRTGHGTIPTNTTRA